MRKPEPMDVSAAERLELEKLVARRKASAGHVRRVRVVLMSADGHPGREIAKRVGLSEEQVSRIRRRFIEGRVAGLADRPKAGRKDQGLSAKEVDVLVQTVLSPPPAGRSRWTARLLARRFKVSHVTIAKILRARDIKPHLKRTYKVSRDPRFDPKTTDIVGLYLNPPENAVVLSVDEKTQVQALERTQLPLPLRQGRAVRHTHDYKRHGVIDLYAALNVATGEVAHAFTERHTAVEFLAFMKKVARLHRDGELHVILDNSSSHSTPAIKAWLAENPRVHFHFTPTSASWLNEVEAFFGILTKQALSMVDFPSKAALRRHIEAFLKSWNDHPTPFIWTKPADALIETHRRMLERI